MILVTIDQYYIPPYVYAVISYVSYGSKSVHYRFGTFHPLLFGEVVIFTIDSLQRRAVGRPCGNPNQAPLPNVYQRQSITVGDVDILTESGGFYLSVVLIVFIMEYFVTI